MEEQGKRMSLMLKDVVKYWSSGALWNNNGGGGGAPSQQPDEGNSEGKGGPRRRRSSVKNSTNNDLQREPHTRDVTAVFEHMRRSYRTRGNKQLELIMNKKTKLSYDRKAKEEEARNRSSYGLLWKTGSWIGKGEDPSYNSSVDEQDSAKYVYKCSLCAAPFKMLIRKKYQCPLCERYVCSSCFTERVELDPVFFNEEAVTIMVCKNCKLYVQQGEEKQQFEEALERADNHPLVYYHGILSEILQLLSTLLPKFTDMVLAEDVSVENLKAAGKLEVHLLELFRNFDIGVKKVVAIPLDDPRDKRIQANIKLSLVNFLQENLMKFKALQKQRKELLAQAMEDERSGKKKISSKNDKGVGDTEKEPFIISFEPAMSPMAGTIISIHGENFFKDTVVLIDGAKCKTKFVAKDNLICQSPILFEEGLKDIEVINPDKRSYKLSRVLFYSQDKELFSKQSKVQTNPEGQGRTGMSDKGKETADSALSSLAGIEGKEHDSLQELVATMPDSEVLLNTTSTAAGSVASGKPSQRSFIEDSSLPGPPNIRMVHPAISPLQGTQIRLTGDNFSSGSRVLVGGKEATQVQLLERATSSNSCVMQMQSPPLSAGQHKVEIINPGGAHFVLDGVLFYTDDPVLVGPASSTTSNKQHTIARQTPTKTRQAASPTRISSEAGTRSTSPSTRASATAASTPPATPPATPPNRWGSTNRQPQPTNRAQMSPHAEAGNGYPLSEEKEREEDGTSGPLSTGMSFRAGFSGSGHKRNKSKGVSSWGW